MDHEEMRAAYLRALNTKDTVFNQFCNTCKLDYDEKSGEIVNIESLDTLYKVWYCESCLAGDFEYVS